jgi:hypothetical protein
MMVPHRQPTTDHRLMRGRFNNNLPALQINGLPSLRAYVSFSPAFLHHFFRKQPKHFGGPV